MIKSIEKLKGHIPDLVYDQIPPVADKYDITNNLRLCHFISQCYHESMGFKVVYENLNYKPDRLALIFKSDFDTNKDGKLSSQELKKVNLLANNPERIANFVYANQGGNGPESSGDGWKYRGRGYIQCTLKDNYRLLSKEFGVDFIADPDLVATEYPLVSGAWFFKRNNLWAICDKGSDEKTVTALTKRINGGYNGLKERKQLFNKFWQIIS